MPCLIINKHILCFLATSFKGTRWNFSLAPIRKFLLKPQSVYFAFSHMLGQFEEIPSSLKYKQLEEHINMVNNEIHGSQLKKFLRRGAARHKFIPATFFVLICMLVWQDCMANCNWRREFFRINVGISINELQVSLIPWRAFKIMKLLIWHSLTF